MAYIVDYSNMLPRSNFIYSVVCYVSFFRTGSGHICRYHHRRVTGSSLSMHRNMYLQKVSYFAPAYGIVSYVHMPTMTVTSPPKCVSLLLGRSRLSTEVVLIGNTSTRHVSHKSTCTCSTLHVIQATNAHIHYVTQRPTMTIQHCARIIHYTAPNKNCCKPCTKSRRLCVTVNNVLTSHHLIRCSIPICT